MAANRTQVSKAPRYESVAVLKRGFFNLFSALINGF